MSSQPQDALAAVVINVVVQQENAHANVCYIFSAHQRYVRNADRGSRGMSTQDEATSSGLGQ